MEQNYSLSMYIRGTGRLWIRVVRFCRPEMIDGGAADTGDDGRGTMPEYGWVDRGSS